MDFQETECTRVHARPPLDPQGQLAGLLTHLQAGRERGSAKEVVEWVGELARWGRGAAVRAAVAIGRLHLHVSDGVPPRAAGALGIADRWVTNPTEENARLAADGAEEARSSGVLWATVPLALIAATDETERFRQLLEVAAEDACRRHAPDEVRAVIEARLRRWARGSARFEPPSTRTTPRL